MYKGHVYLKETAEPVAGICVTDGRNMVRTDENGAFALEGWERAHVISVCVLTNCHSDWFCMIENHEGDYDFYITPAQTRGGHSFLHISDTEIVHGCGPWLEFVKRCVKEENPGFLIQTGDICRIQGLEKHYKEMNYVTMGCPVRYTLGNHDYVDDKYGEYSFERLYGPVWYSFDFGNVHYIVVPMKSGEAPGCYQREDSDIWIKKDLEMKEPGRKVVFFCHNMFDLDENKLTISVQGEELDLRKYDLLAWCFGHSHIHFGNELNGVYTICTARPDTGGIDSSPAAVRKTQIHEDGTLTSKLLYNDISQAKEGDAGMWRTQLDERILYCSPLYEEDTLFVATFHDGFPKNTAIYALDPSDGSVLWKYDTCNGVKGEMSHAHECIFAQDCFGWVYCLQASSGTLLWKTLVDMGGYPHHTNQNVLVEDGIVFAGCSRKVTALDAVTGEIIWSSDWNGKSEGCPSRFVLAGDLLIVSSQWYGVYALDKKNGKKVWENRKIRFRSSSIGVWGKRLYTASGQNLICLDRDSGELIYSYKPTPEREFDTTGIPVRDDGNLYMCTVDSGIVCYDIMGLQQNAEYSCGPSIVSAVPYVETGSCQVHGRPIIEGKQLIFGAADGYLHIYDTETAEEIYSFHVGAPLFASPVRVGELLIAADFNGRITAYKWN